MRNPQIRDTVSIQLTGLSHHRGSKEHFNHVDQNPTMCTENAPAKNTKGNNDIDMIEKAYRILRPVIQEMDDHQYRRTNKAYPKDYLKNFNLNSVEWLRYLKIFDIIRKTDPLSVNRSPSVLEIGTN